MASHDPHPYTITCLDSPSLALPCSLVPPHLCISVDGCSLFIPSPKYESDEDLTLPTHRFTDTAI